MGFLSGSTGGSGAAGFGGVRAMGHKQQAELHDKTYSTRARKKGLPGEAGLRPYKKGFPSTGGQLGGLKGFISALNIPGGL